MVRERIKELVDFATTESPYRNATKGWLTDDVYINWGKSQEKAISKSNELANVSLYWKPVSQLVSIIFAVVFLASIFVFSAVSLAHGRFQIFNEPAKVVSEKNQIVSKEIEPTVEIEPTELELASKQSLQSVDSKSEVAPVLESQNEFAKSQTRSDFAAAALGGQKIKR